MRSGRPSKVSSRRTRAGPSSPSGSFTVQPLPSPERCRTVTPQRARRRSAVSKYTASRLRGMRATLVTPSAIPSSGGSSKPAQAPIFTSRSVAIAAPAPAGPLEGQLLEPEMGVDADLGGDLRPAAVAVQLPGQAVVGQVDVEDFLEPGVQIRVGHRGHGLDPAVQIAG